MYHTTLFFIDLEYIFIPTGLKKRLLMLGGYTFAQISEKHWYCSKKKLGCKAKVKMEDGRVVAANNVHCHSPPTYHVTKAGQYILMRAPN